MSAMNTRMSPKVAMLVLNWNGKENTSECIESLQKVDYPSYEIIIVDNASTDGSQEFLKRRFHGILLIANKENLGFGGGFNVGIKEAINRNSQYVLCLNNDVVVDSQILRELVRIGELSAEIGGLCPMEYYYDEAKRIQCAGGVFRFAGCRVFGRGELDHGQHNKVRETELLSGPAMMLKVSTILNIGFFDPDFFYGPEDIDIALRATRSGYKLMFVPSAKLWHKHRGSTGKKITPLNVYFQVRNLGIFLKKHANRLEYTISILFFAVFTLPNTLIRCFVNGNGFSCVEAAMDGLVWHLNHDYVLTEPEMANYYRLAQFEGRRKGV